MQFTDKTEVHKELQAQIFRMLDIMSHWKLIRSVSETQDTLGGSAPLNTSTAQCSSLVPDR